MNRGGNAFDLVGVGIESSAPGWPAPGLGPAAGEGSLDTALQRLVVRKELERVDGNLRVGRRSARDQLEQHIERLIAR